jgi:hypothetical protein
MQFRNPSRLKPLAAADRGNHQVERRVVRVAALLDEVFGRVVGDADLDESLVLLVVFAEVSAKAALAVVYVKHFLLLSSDAEQ